MSRRKVCRGIAVLLAIVAAVPVGTAAAAPPLSASGFVGVPVPGEARGPHPRWLGGTPGRVGAERPEFGAERRGAAGSGCRGAVKIPAWSGEDAARRCGPRGRDKPPPALDEFTDREGARGTAEPFGDAGTRPTLTFGDGRTRPATVAGDGRTRPASGSRRAGTRPSSACRGGRRGPYQRQAERWLRLKADGKQSAADCRAIRAFQKKHGIEPVTGIAGPATWARMRILAARSAPHATRGCPDRSYRIACVDLTHGLTWVQQRGRILYGPVPMRSGGVRHPTRTGWFRIYWRHRNHWSTLYNSPMPYAQFFSGGQAFHAVRGSIRTVGGSMGCVNLRLADARGLWKVLRTRDHVYVWGRRPGS